MNRPRMQMFTKTDRVLAAIDGRTEVETAPSIEQEIGLALIDSPPTQPRKYFDPDKLVQLQASIQQQGILEPLLVRPKSDGRYELVAGERRFRVATDLQLEKVPVVIKELTDAEVLEVALVENLQRENLNPVEELEGIIQLISMKLAISQPGAVSLLHRMLNEHKNLVNSNVTVNGEGSPNSNATVRVKQILAALGITNWLSFVSNRLPLLTLPQDVLEALRNGKIEYTKAKAIASLKDPEERQWILEDAIAQNLTIRQIQERLKGLNPRREPEPIKAQILNLSKKAGNSKALQDATTRVKIENLIAELDRLLSN